MVEHISDPRRQAPLELLVEEVSDLDPVLVEDEQIGEFALQPGDMVLRAASRGAFVVFAQNVATGRSVALEPAQVWGGWGSFVALPDISCAYFVEAFEPFGGQWPEIAIDACLGLVRHWRSCYRLDDEVARLEAALVNACGEGDRSTVVAWTPTYVLSLNAEELDRAAKAVRSEYRAFGRGEAMRSAAHSAGDGEYLTSVQVAELLGVTEQTVRRWRVMGKGPPWSRPGGGSKGRVVYRRTALDQWLADREGRGHPW